jgi:hypothetical protein
MCHKLKTKYPCEKGCFDIKYTFCAKLLKCSPSNWKHFKEIARDKEHGHNFHHKYRLPDGFCLSERGCGELVKRAFFYPRSGMAKCTYCSAVCEGQTRLGEGEYASGCSPSPEPEIGIASNEEPDSTDNTGNIQELGRP